ncbi:MAG TPA: FmdB family zinc ribbon protein [Acidimicrobiales bacterium]|nr:FmdB family zinc ribbon protein [Acidimicrobiales bacterium]
MPTYEYACRSCGEHLEVVQSFTDEPLTECPACGGTLRKVFGAIGIAFKGSGFYKTDSRTGAGSSRSTSDTKTDGTADGGGGSKTEAAPSKSDSSTSPASSKPDTKAPPKSDSKAPAAS